MIHPPAASVNPVNPKSAAEPENVEASAASINDAGSDNVVGNVNTYIDGNGVVIVEQAKDHGDDDAQPPKLPLHRRIMKSAKGLAAKHPRKLILTAAVFFTGIALLIFFVNIVVNDYACFFLEPPYKTYAFATTDPNACNNIISGVYATQLQSKWGSTRHLNQTFNIVLFGDSMVLFSDQHHNLTGKIKWFLPQYQANLKFFNYGKAGDHIAGQLSRLPSVFTSVFSQVSHVDAWLMFSDSDVDDTEWCGKSNKNRQSIMDAYISSTNVVIDTVRATIPHVFIALGSPWADGEGGHGCRNLPYFWYLKNTVYPWFQQANANIASARFIPLMDFRGAFVNTLPSSWNDFTGCMTEDGEHHNDRGTWIIAQIFAQTLLTWLDSK